MASSEGGKGVRAGETSGLLMSIIRTLYSSTNIDEREKEKLRLEKSYRESDVKLDKLLNEHLTDLTSILQAFSKISARVTTSQERIRAIKDNLQSCKNLLHCKRDELRKLWIEGIEHKSVVAMLDQIEKINHVGHQLGAYTEQKHYLHATELLSSSVAQLEGDLLEVDALRDVRMELTAKKEELHEVLIEELHKQIYVKSTSAVVKGFQRSGSQRQSRRSDKTSLIKQVLTGQPIGDSAPDGIYDKRLASLTSVNLEEVAKPHDITEDVNVNPEDDPVYFIAILIECLAMLRKLPEAIDAIRSRIKPGLLAIVQRASQQVSDNAYFEGEELSASHNTEYLLELLELILQQFKIVAHVHQIVLANLSRVKTSNPKLSDICLYDTVEVWMKIQAVLQLFLSDYLDIRNTSSQSQATTNFDEPATDVQAYFAKKRPAKLKKFALFRFDASSHAISMNSYLREQRQEFYGSGEILNSTDGADAGSPQFVCKPGANNITVIYNPLQKFMKEIENATKQQPGGCTLQAFTTEFIKNMYLRQVMYNIQNNIDSATKGDGSGFDAQRTIIDQRTQKELAVPKPLLQSTVSVARNVTELEGLMSDLPDYADQFLNMICKVLQDYKDTCHTSYREIVMPDSTSDEKRIISATWAKDEDVNRFLRCLPNWRSLKDENPSLNPEISEEDMRALNSKESSILTSNLSSTESLIPQQEILTDVVHMRTLGNMCESLEWFSCRIKQLAKRLSTKQHSLPLPDANSETHLTVSESTLEMLLSLAKDFQELGELCLLVLHLEVRVHCFYYLMPVATQSNYSGAIDDMDPDSNVIKLNKDLTSIEEVMGQSLQPTRFKYIFEGLGHLVSTILINSTHYLKRINENGIKKMCRNIFAVQQCLTNITMNRESDLDHARQYYELLYLSPDDIISTIMERGQQFQEHDYTNLLSLAHRSERGASDEELTKRINKLKDILTELESVV